MYRVAALFLCSFLFSCSEKNEETVDFRVERGVIVQLPDDFTLVVASIHLVPDQIVLANCYYEFFDKNGSVDGHEYIASWYREHSKVVQLSIENTTDPYKSSSLVRKSKLLSSTDDTGELLTLVFGADAFRKENSTAPLSSILSVGFPSTSKKHFYFYTPSEMRSYDDSRNVLGYLLISERMPIEKVPRTFAELSAIMGDEDRLLEFTYRVGPSLSDS